ncbi:hypothetical protein ACWDFR_06070 [Streptomyces sp. 900105755]
MNEAMVGSPESCDWCGRPGSVIQFDCWAEDGTLIYRDPALCLVCELLTDADSGDVGDAFYQVATDLDLRLASFEAGLAARWREKVRAGQRQPQRADERPPGWR